MEEYSGPLADLSPVWKEWYKKAGIHDSILNEQTTEELRAAEPAWHPGDSKDGIFWMPYEQFLTSFSKFAVEVYPRTAARAGTQRAASAVNVDKQQPFRLVFPEAAP